MTKTWLFFLAGLLAGGLLTLAAPVLSQDGEDPHAKYGREVPSTPEAQAEMMKQWQAAMTPGKYHERLAYFLGDWKTTMKMWMGGEGSGEPSIADGKSAFRWLVEGRWMAQEYAGSMMGMPVQGFGLTGYDNFRGQFVGLWVENMGTAMTTMEGGIDRTGRRIEMFGKVDEPMLNQVGKTAKYVTQILTDDSFVFEIHDLDIIGGNTKVIEVTYSRVK